MRQTAKFPGAFGRQRAKRSDRRENRAGEFLLQVGLTRADLEEGWSLLRDACGLSDGYEEEPSTAEAADAIRTIDAWDEQGLMLVRATIAHRFPQQASFLLAGLTPHDGPEAVVGVATLLSAAIGVYLGVISAWNRGKAVDRVSTGTTLTFYSMPEWWLGLLLIAAFGVGIGPLPGLFPTGGLHSTEYSGDSPVTLGYLGDTALHLVLPVLTLVLVWVASPNWLWGLVILAVLGALLWWGISARARYELVQETETEKTVPV